jgi:hypothetical protein
MFNGLNDPADAKAMRRPPQNTDAEEWVLAALMLDNSLGDEPAIQRLKPGDFYRDAHQRIFAVIADRFAANKPVDAMLVRDDLERLGQLDGAGGIEGLASIVNSVPHAANGAYHAEIVKQKATVRRVIEIAGDLIDDGYSNEFTAEQLVERRWSQGPQRPESRPPRDAKARRGVQFSQARPDVHRRHPGPDCRPDHRQRPPAAKTRGDPVHGDRPDQSHRGRQGR